MKILILHQHFRTPQDGGAIRSYYLAKALQSRGRVPVVVTAHNERVYAKKDVEGIEVHYLPVAYDNKFGFTARSISFLKFAWKSAWLAGRLGPFETCYAISVPLTTGWAAMWIKFRANIPYIFEVGDLWPDAPIEMGFVKNYFFKQLLYWMERSIYREAESIVALSPMIRIAIEKKLPGKKIHVIPNMADCDFYRPEVKETRIDERFGTRDKFVVSYIGAVGAANGLDYFLDCARAAAKEGLPIRFLLCGEGALRERLKRSASQLGLQNLEFVDFVNRDGVKGILNITDAVFVCYKHVPILETGSPNKFFDGLAAGKLIIVNFGGWISDEVQESQCGISVNPNSPVDFVKKIRFFIEHRDQLQRFQASARKLAEQKYSREQLSDQFASIFPES